MAFEKIKKIFKKKESRERVLNENNSVALIREVLGLDKELTTDEAMNIPSFCACVNYISSIIASLPIKLYRETMTTTEDGKEVPAVKEVVGDKRIALLNDKTGDLMTAYQMKQALIIDYLTSGAGYIYINKEFNEVKSLHYVNRDYVSFLHNNDPIFKTASILINGRTYREFEFLRLLRHSKDGYSGTGVVKENRLILDVAYSSLKLELASVKAGGNKKGFLQTVKKVEESVLDEIREKWNNFYSNAENRMMVLNEGITFKETSASAAEMQMYEQKSANGEEICRIFNLSLDIISGKANDDEQASAVKAAITPIIIDLQTVLNLNLLLESEQSSMYFVVDMTELVKGDILKRYRAYQIGLNANFMQADEVRYKEDMPPLGLDFIKLGLNDVLYDPKTKTVYTPNTNQMTDISQRALKISDLYDIIEERYEGQPRRRGKFWFGKFKMSQSEYTRVSHQFATDFPRAVKGKNYGYFNRNHFYVLNVIEFGTYKFLAKVSIVGNGDKINLIMEALKNET